MSTKETIRHADNYARQKNYRKAILWYQHILKHDPDNPEVLAKKGLVHLLAGNRRMFISIYHKLKQVISSLADIPSSLAKLWAKYQYMFTRIAATCLVLAGLSATSCKSRRNQTRYYYITIPYQPLTEKTDGYKSIRQAGKTTSFSESQRMTSCASTNP